MYCPPVADDPAALPGRKFAPPPLVKMTPLAETEYRVPVAEPENVVALHRTYPTRVDRQNVEANAGVPVSVMVFVPPDAAPE